jgi:hypothetical protein
MDLHEVTISDAAGDFGGAENVPRKAVTMGVGTILQNAKEVRNQFDSFNERDLLNQIEFGIDPPKKKDLNLKPLLTLLSLDCVDGLGKQESRHHQTSSGRSHDRRSYCFVLADTPTSIHRCGSRSWTEPHSFCAITQEA